jgi:hypothetical protein
VKLHKVIYTARTADGGTNKGVATVPSERNRPSWRECALVIPGFLRGTYAGLAPESDTYTVEYSRCGIVFRWSNRTHAEALKLAGYIAERAVEVGGIGWARVVNSSGDDVTRTIPALFAVI